MSHHTTQKVYYITPYSYIFESARAKKSPLMPQFILMPATHRGLSCLRIKKLQGGSYAEWGPRVLELKAPPVALLNGCDSGDSPWPAASVWV